MVNIAIIKQEKPLEVPEIMNVRSFSFYTGYGYAYSVEQTPEVVLEATVLLGLKLYEF